MKRPSSTGWTRGRREEARFQRLGNITAEPRESWAADKDEAVEVRFSVWTGLAAHRPLENTKCARKAPYRHSASFRGQFNKWSIHEPTGAIERRNLVVGALLRSHTGLEITMTFTKFAAVTATAFLLASAGSAYAQQGTTLAGPSQGSKSDGSSSTQPSAAAGATGAEASGNAALGGAKTGVESGRTTATGGNPGGPVGRN